LVRVLRLLRRGEREYADDVFGRWVPLPSVALGGHVRLVVGAGYPVLLGYGLSAKMAGRRGHLSQEVSYDVYVKDSVDGMGRDEFGEAVAHFVERSNAVALKRRLEARGETVRVERSTVYGLSEAGKKAWFSDYCRIPEYEPPRDQAPPTQSAPLESREEAVHRATEGAPRVRAEWGGAAFSKGHREPWWKRWFG
jgi:hypothetical protein